MDETQISITVKPLYIERLIYWIIIIALAVLLIMSYLKDDHAPEKTTTQDTTAKAETAAPAPIKETPTTPAAEPDDTCTNAKKDGDETDVDCGGSCGVKCASGKGCKATTDCVSNICTAGACTNTPPTSLSGKLELDVTKAAFTKSGTSVKVSGVDFKIANGLDHDITGAQIYLFLKNKNGVRCLNQASGSSDCDTPFARIAVTRVASGKSITESHELQKDEYESGSYVMAGDYYVAGESFVVVAYLYDGNGDMIDGKTVTDSVTVNP